MMELLRSWILAALIAALLMGVLEALMPDGPVRQVGRMAIGLVLFLVLVHPLLSWIPDTLRQNWREQAAQASVYSPELEQTNESYLESIMSQRCAEYIQAEAEKLGVQVQATVSCRQQEALPVPYSVEIQGSLSAETTALLSDRIQEDLGISAEQITFGEEQP